MRSFFLIIISWKCWASICDRERRNNIKTALKFANDFWNEPYFPPRHRHLSIYGGEPTLHPQWNEILRILHEEYADWPFVILTNGRTFRDKKFPLNGDKKYDYILCREDIVAHDRNIFWRIDYKDEPRDFIPTLVAPVDILENKDELSYFHLAEKHCPFYARCETLIYQNKGYFCINAGPMDSIYHDGANGWEISPGQNPFFKSNQEVEAQAKLFCHRCNWSIFWAADSLQSGLGDKLKQDINKKSFISKTNEPGIKPGTFHPVHFETSCSKDS